MRKPKLYANSTHMNIIAITRLSIPIKNSMKKKRIDHSWGKGIWEIALG
jgi:hypothetical protein